jgi:ADP-heptose:LPS heptosyltransferase
MLKKAAKRGGKKILLAWNRGLGDIALGLYAMVQRIREMIPDAEITFLTRENLKEGFSMLEGVNVLIAPWKRGEKVNVKKSIRELGIDPNEYDLLLEKPDPTAWVSWQIGKVIPRLKWREEQDALWRRFDIKEDEIYIGVQVVAETNHGPWRNWPLSNWEKLFARLPHVKFLLFGYGNTPSFQQKNCIDLRGKTTLFEMLSLIKKCYALVLPDSGILSIAYYLDTSFPIKVVSLWADCQGVLKQNVASPNPQLVHLPLIGKERDLTTISVSSVIDRLFPVTPLKSCPKIETYPKGSLEKVGAIILAGGQGTRLGIKGPKGLFTIGNKALFAWLCEKVPSKNFPIAVMTSPLNHRETVAFFEKNKFFGLDIQFFQQEMMPFLNEKREPMELSGPNGNGSVFRSFVRDGLAELFAKKGVDTVSVIPVENPLANPFDSRLITYHRSIDADITVKCIRREPTDRLMGALVERGGRLEVVEYTELDSKETYYYSNIGQLAFKLSFIEEMAKNEIPIHWVKKQGLWKGEHFIFDALLFAKKSGAIETSRKTCYAPIKSRDCVETVQKILEQNTVA